jgi:hypothetical protein
MLVPAESRRCSMAVARVRRSPRGVEVFEAHAHRWLFFPAMATVVAIEEQVRVLLLRHHCGRRAHALVRLRFEDERCELSGRRRIEHDHLPPVADVQAAHLNARGRLEAGEHRRDVAERDVRDLLANEPAVWARRRSAPCHPRRSRRRRSSRQRASIRRSSLELERLGFAMGDERLEGGERDHAAASAPEGATSVLTSGATGVLVPRR